MKQLKCSDVGGGECPFVAKGDTDDEVMEKMGKHGMEMHADNMKDQTEADKKNWEADARSKITDA